MYLHRVRWYVAPSDQLLMLKKCRNKGPLRFGRSRNESPSLRWVFRSVPDDLGEMCSILVGVELIGSGHGHAHRRERVQNANALALRGKHLRKALVAVRRFVKAAALEYHV